MSKNTIWRNVSRWMVFFSSFLLLWILDDRYLVG
nr:MAG TPA: Protein of unknown function (DUF751) [Caudoviricetes sp.]